MHLSARILQELLFRVLSVLNLSVACLLTIRCPFFHRGTDGVWKSILFRDVMDQVQRATSGDARCVFVLPFPLSIYRPPFSLPPLSLPFSLPLSLSVCLYVCLGFLNILWETVMYCPCAL